MDLKESNLNLVSFPTISVLITIYNGLPLIFLWLMMKVRR